MKITLAYIPDEEETATATAAVLRQLHPGAKVRKSDRHPPFKHIYLPLKSLKTIVKVNKMFVRFSQMWYNK